MIAFLLLVELHKIQYIHFFSEYASGLCKPCLIQCQQEHVGTCKTPWTAQIRKQERRWMPFLEILSQKGQMTLKIKVNDPHFQYQPRVFQHACLVQLSWFKPKYVSYCADKPNFLEFNTSQENPKMHVWFKFGDFSTNPLAVIAQTSQISKNSEWYYCISLEPMNQEMSTVRWLLSLW